MPNSKEIFLEELYIAHSTRITNWAYRHVGDYERAKDIMQETFLVAVVKIDDIMVSENPKGWLYKTARNIIGHALREMKTKKQQQYEFNEQQTFEYIDLGLVEIFPPNFSDNDKLLLVMYYLERRTIKEISNLFGISVSACKMRLLRLRKALNNIL